MRVSREIRVVHSKYDNVCVSVRSLRLLGTDDVRTEFRLLLLLLYGNNIHAPRPRRDIIIRVNKTNEPDRRKDIRK